MKVLLPLLVVSVALLLAQSTPAQNNPGAQSARTYSGCLAAANGLLLLAQPGGHAYALHGNTDEISKYLDHTAQIQGIPEKPQNPRTIGAALRVKSWKITGECHLNLSSVSRQSQAWKKSGEPAVPISGKTGPQAAAVPITSNRSVGETTPPSNVQRNRIFPARPQAGQPPVAEDLAQNPQAANRIAIAAQRAEIGTHNGTVGAPGEPGTGTLASEQSPAKFFALVRMDGEQFEPAKLTIAVGQTVEWKNTSGDPHTVTLVPDKVLVPADAALPSKAQPFDSGTIPAGMTFIHTFTVPGTYRYYCTLHEGNGMVGEVVVK